MNEEIDSAEQGDLFNSDWWELNQELNAKGYNISHLPKGEI